MWHASGENAYTHGRVHAVTSETITFQRQDQPQNNSTCITLLLVHWFPLLQLSFFSTLHFCNNFLQLF